MFLQSSAVRFAPVQIDLVFDFRLNKPSDFVFFACSIPTAHVESKTV